MVLFILSVSLGGIRAMYGFLMMHCIDRMPEPFGMRSCVASPLRMIRRPFRMIRVHPAGIVFMPPVVVAPHMTRVVGADSVRCERVVFVGMVLHERLQFRMVMAELPGVK